MGALLITRSVPFLSNPEVISTRQTLMDLNFPMTHGPWEEMKYPILNGRLLPNVLVLGVDYLLNFGACLELVKVMRDSQVRTVTNQHIILWDLGHFSTTQRFDSKTKFAPVCVSGALLQSMSEFGLITLPIPSI